MKNLTTNNLEVPWIEMHSDAQRRVDSVEHDFFWIRDYQSQFGLMLTFNTETDRDIDDLNIQGLSITKNKQDSNIKLYLILKNNEDLEIFTALCCDLIAISVDYSDQEKLFDIILSRLRQWQRFLSKGASLALNQQLQMGLFTELSFMYDYLARSYDIDQAISFWTGPDRDKKDFSTAHSFIEIKSLISSKTPSIIISSLHQLESFAKPLYLGVYHLTRNELGLSAFDMISNILEIINNSELSNRFINQLCNYGYFHGLTLPPNTKWSIDATIFYEVSDNFPKLIPSNIAVEIVDATYSIDMSRCQQHRVDYSKIRI